MKDSLVKLYQGRDKDFKSIKNQIEKATGPLLMSPNEKYAKQPNRLLIVGQETHGWAENYDNVLKNIELYEWFNLGEKYNSRPFWNVTRKLERALNNEIYSCAWTNISKFDVDSKRPNSEEAKIISQIDDLLIDEIKIIQPDVCIFFTGHHFDNRIKKIYTGVEFVNVSGFSSNELTQLKHKDLPEKTYRTYHPNYLRMRGIEGRFIEFLKVK